MGNKSTKTKEDKKREQEEKKQYKKEQKAKKKSSKKSTNKKQRLARGENSGSEFDTDFDSNPFTGGDSESGVFHSAENLSTSPYLDSGTKSERENSGILWRPSSPSTSRHPQVLSSRDFRDGFSLEACIPPEIARPITYHTDTTISSSCSGGGGGASGTGVATPLGYNCRDNSSGSLKSKRSNSVKSHHQTPTFSRFQNDDVMSVSTSSSQKSSQTGTEGYCTPLMNTPVFGRADRPVSPHSGMPLGHLHEPDRDSMDIVPLPYSPFDPEAKVFTTYNPTIIRGNTSQQQQQQQQQHHHRRQHHFFTQPINYHNLPKPTSPHPQRRAFSPKMTSSPFKMISSDDSSSNPTTPIPQRKAAAAFISDFFKSSGKKKKKKSELEEEKLGENKGETSPKSKKSPLWKTWERSSTRKSASANDNRSSIFGTSRKTDKHKSSVKGQQQKEDQGRSPQTKKDRSSDSTLQDFSINTGGDKAKRDSFEPENSGIDQRHEIISKNGASKNSRENGNDSDMPGGGVDLNLDQNRNSSPPVARSAAFCIMRLEELERNIEKTIKEKFPDAEPFLLRRSPPEEEFRGSKSLPTTPSLKKKLYVSRDVKLSSDDVMSTDLHNLSTKLDKLSDSTRYYDETFLDSSSRAKSPVILRRFGARTRHASISPKIQRAKTAAIYNSPSEMERVAEFKDDLEHTTEGNKNTKKDSSSANNIPYHTTGSQLSFNKNNIAYSGSSPSNSSSSSPKTERTIREKPQAKPNTNRQSPSSTSDVRLKTNTPRQLIRQHCVEYPEKIDSTQINNAPKTIHQNTKPVVVKTESAVFGSISPKLKRPSREHAWKDLDSNYNQTKGSNNTRKQTEGESNNCSNSEMISTSKVVIKRKPKETETRAQTITNRRSGSLDSLVDAISSGGDCQTFSQRMMGRGKDKQPGRGEFHKARVLPIPLVKHSTTDKNSSPVSVKSRVRSINKSLSEEAATMYQARRNNSSSESDNVLVKSLPSSPTDWSNQRGQNRNFGAVHHARTDTKHITDSGGKVDDRRGEKSRSNSVTVTSAISPTLPRQHSAEHVIFGTAVALPCRVYASASTAPKVVSPTLSPTTGNRNQLIRFAHAQSSVKSDEINSTNLECERKQNVEQRYREERKEIKIVKETAVFLPTERKPGREDRIGKVENRSKDYMSNEYGNNNSSNNKNIYDKRKNTPITAQVDVEFKHEGLHNRKKLRRPDDDGDCGNINNTRDYYSSNSTPSGRDGPDRNTTKICVGNERQQQQQVSYEPICDTNISNASVSDYHLDHDDNRFKTRNASVTVSVSKASNSGSCSDGKIHTGKKVSGSRVGGSKGIGSHSIDSGRVGGGSGSGSGCGRDRDQPVSGDRQQQQQQQQHQSSPSRLFHQTGGDVIIDRTLRDSGGLQSGSSVSRNLDSNNGSVSRCLQDNNNDESGVFARKFNEDKSFSKELPFKRNNNSQKAVSAGVDGGGGLWENNGADGKESFHGKDSGDDFSSSGKLIKGSRERGERNEVSYDDGIRDTEIGPNDKQVKYFVGDREDDGGKQKAVLKQPISQVISDMINVSKQNPPHREHLDYDDSHHHKHDQRHQHHHHHHHHEQPESQTSPPRQSSPTTPDNDRLVTEEATVAVATRPYLYQPLQSLEERTISRQSHSPVPHYADDNDNIEIVSFKPDVDNSKNELIAASSNQVKVLNKSSDERTTDDSDIERFMKSVKESVIPTVFGNEKGEKCEHGDMDVSSSVKEIKQPPPPPSPNTLDRLISEFDEEDEEGEDSEEDDVYVGDEGRNRMRTGNRSVNLALTRQTEMKDFTDRVINRLSDLLGGELSGAEYILEDDDDVFVDDSNDDDMTMEGGAQCKNVSNYDESSTLDLGDEKDFNDKNNEYDDNNDDDKRVNIKGRFQSLEITNSSFEKESLKTGSLQHTPPKSSPVLKEKLLFSRFSTSSSLSTSSTSSTSSSDLFAPPPPKPSSTMPGFEGFEKSFDNTKSQSKTSPKHQKDVSKPEYSQQIDQRDDDDGYFTRKTQTRSYHSDDDVARGGGIPEYYDDKPLWNKHQKPPGQMSVKMASVRRRERRERWLKKRKRNRTDFISACSSEVASEHSSNHGRSRLSLDGDFEDEEVTNLSTQTQKGALGSGILTSPKYTKPIMPFWGSRERIKTPPEPAEEELIHPQHRTVVSENVSQQQFIDIGKTYLPQSRHRRRDKKEEASNVKMSDTCKTFDNTFKSIELPSSINSASGDYNKINNNNTPGVIKIPGLEETFDELMSVQQILEGFQSRTSVAAASPTPTHNNNNTKTSNTLSQSHSKYSLPDSKLKCMPLTEENIKSMKEQLKESCNYSNSNNNTFNCGRFSRLSNTNRTESDLDLYSEYRDDASSDSNLYADDEGDDNDDDGNDPYTTAEDDLDASVGDADLENNVVVSCTFYNSNTYQQQPPNLSQDIGNRPLVFTASPGTSGQHPQTFVSSVQNVGGYSGGGGGASLMTPVITCRSSTEEDLNYLNISGTRDSSSSTIGDTLGRSFTPTSQNSPSTTNTYKDSDNNNIAYRCTSYVRSNSAPGMYSGHQLSIPRAEANPNTGSYHASMAASNVDNSDEEFWADRPPLERSHSYHHPRTLQQSGAAGPTASGASGTVSRTFQNAREQMMDIQHHLQALRRQMEGLQDDLTTSTSYTMTPDFSAYDSK